MPPNSIGTGGATFSHETYPCLAVEDPVSFRRNGSGLRGAEDRMKRLALIAAAVILSSSAGARTMQQKLEAACAADYQRLCPEKAGDPDGLKACMLARRARASTECMRLIDASE